ncbi:MAG: hypothetical protein KatS3mg061_1371 [Dehalococcoidia bacterium]|nr:MAG: hypothetical protein KatS3mg061_1371 [Dehalococcoidia bacterium]
MGLSRWSAFRPLGPGFDDPGRVAAQVVTGIGFLGAAAIFREGRGVKGVTTAATVWMMAAIGLAAGAGLYLITVVATLVTFLTLTLVRRGRAPLPAAPGRPREQEARILRRSAQAEASVAPPGPEQPLMTALSGQAAPAPQDGRANHWRA